MYSYFTFITLIDKSCIYMTIWNHLTLNTGTVWNCKLIHALLLNEELKQVLSICNLCMLSYLMVCHNFYFYVLFSIYFPMFTAYAPRDHLLHTMLIILIYLIEHFLYLYYHYITNIYI